MNRRFEKERECAFEYSLPDYMGDVKKLLVSRARVVPGGKFVSDGTVEVSSSVEYDLLYLDSSGKLTAVNTSSDFSESFDVDGDTYIDSLEQSNVSMLKVRVTGPRKIYLKSGVKTLLTVSEECKSALLGEEFSKSRSDIEKCTAQVSFATSVFEKSPAVEYAEVLESFEDLSMDGAEIILTRVVPKITSVKASDSEVTLKGENVVSAIILAPDGTPRPIKKTFSFEERIAVEGAKENMSVLAGAEVCSASASVNADGEYMSAIADFSVQYSVELTENKALEVITDAYIPKAECRNKYSDTEFSELLEAGQERFYVTAKFDKAQESLEEISEVICVGAEVSSVNYELLEDGCRFYGDIIVNGVGYERNVDGSITYIPFKNPATFDEKVNISCQNKDKNLLDYSLIVEECEVINEEGSLLVRCPILLKYHLTSKKSVRMVTSCEMEKMEENATEKCAVTVYYPQSGERLFDVAKRYGTTSLKIARDNELSDNALSAFDSPDSLVGVRKLIIR